MAPYDFLRPTTSSQLLRSLRHRLNRLMDWMAAIDFAKAFDKVDHSIVWHKLKQLGITGKVGLWIKDFLTGRTQQVAANGVFSDPAPVISGVPQGSFLGPILFIIMISDLGKELSYSKTSKNS